MATATPNPQPTTAEQHEAAVHFLQNIRNFATPVAVKLAADLYVFRGTPEEYLRDLWEEDVPEILREYVDWARLASDEGKAGSYEVFEWAGNSWVADVQDLMD